MPVEFTYRCSVVSGLHARPCSRIAEIASRFVAHAHLTNLRNQYIAEMRSTLALLSADVQEKDECCLTFTGTDESAAASAIRLYIEQVLPAEEEAPTSREAAQKLPRVLRQSAAKAVLGVALSRGVGQGVLVIAEAVRLPMPSGRPSWGEGKENAAFDQAVTAVGGSLAQSEGGSAQSAIAVAQRAILTDPAFAARVRAHIGQGSSAADAVLYAAQEFAERLSRSTSAYIRERAIDIEEVSLRLHRELTGGAAARPAIRLMQPAILSAERLGAQDLMQMDRDMLRGIIFASGQTTSHAVILARSLGIPAVSADGLATFRTGEELILDGTRGYVVAASAPVQRFYQREQKLVDRQAARLERFAGHIVAPLAGLPLEVAANASSPEEAEAAFAAGCDGIGLFRTEMLFIGRDEAPTEEEQFAAYARTVKAAGGRPVILRTFDVGGDKPAPFLRTSSARGLDIYKEGPALIQAQLRAMLRAAAFGPVRIMVPLVSSLEQLRWMRAQLFEARKGLQPGGAAVAQDTQLGVMVELPEAVEELEAIAPEADFFSIGTNDLAQYFFRTDRTTTQLDLLSAVREPRFLRLLHRIAAKARAAKKWLGMCGEMAGDARNLPLLIGMGLDEISLAGREALAMKQRIARLDAPECRALWEAALDLDQRVQVETMLDDFTQRIAEPLLADDLIVTSSPAISREDAIHELVVVLNGAGRTPSDDELEDALWDREVAYPTDMGFGFALPHCKSRSVTHDSIAVLQPESPFLWSPESTVPVRAVIMLAMKEEGGAHMQVLSRLARRLMDEGFREQLFSFTEPAQVIQLLAHEIGISQEASR